MSIKSFFGKLLTPFVDEALQRNHYMDGGFGYLGNFYGGVNDSNEPVTVNTGARIAAVYTCINSISQDIAKLPFNVMKFSDANGKQVQKTNPIQRLIHSTPNEYTNAFNFWYCMMWNALTDGNGYALIIRDEMMQPTQLLQLHPYNVTIMRNGMDNFYKVNGIEEMIPQTDMIHIRMYSYDGHIGISPIIWNANAIGYQMKLERFSAQSLGTKGSGFISTNGLSQEQGQAVARMFKESYNSGQIPVINSKGDTKWHNQMITPNEAQYIETKTQSREDIFGIYRFPPTKAQRFDGATFNNSEQQDLVYAKDCLTPWLKLIEQECNDKLFSEANKARTNPLFTKFNLNAILRGDIETRTKYYQFMTTNGVMNADEVRALEDMPPQADGVGQKYYIQGAMVEKGSAPEEENDDTPEMNGRMKDIEQLLHNEN